jgi:transglutaminase-like putative cysteine protease
MTVRELPADITLRGRLNPESAIGGLMALARMLRPSDGWVAVLLLAWNLEIVVGSVTQAAWAPTPSLSFVLLLAMVTGLLLARLPVWGPLILPVGLGIGLLVVVWQLTSFQGGDEAVTNAGELWDRLGLWFAAAKEGSINIDQLPFAFGLSAATWLLGFLAFWLFTRYRNFWGVFILGGAGLLSNLTFLPPDASQTLGFFLFTALLLVARVQAVRRRQEWQRHNIEFDGHLGALSAFDSFLLAAVVLFVAFFVIPEGNKVGPAHDVYESLRSPLKNWEDDFNRLFAGLPARRPLGYRIWGDVMAFQGTIQPTTAEVLRVESPAPLYWKARTYGTYTAKGWVSQDTTFQPMDWVPSYTVDQQPLNRTEVTYFLTPNYSTRSLFAGGLALATDREANVETYDSPTYTLDLYDPGTLQALPSGLAAAADGLQGIISQPGARDSTLAASLPPEFRLLEVIRSEGVARQAILAEALPEQADVLSLRSTSGKIKAGQSYSVTSSISQATPLQLRRAGTDFPTWAMVRYTELPDDLPQRVRDLGAQLTAEALTPYDRAKAIEAYLAGFPYSLKVDPPPFNSDGVDHFLFTLKQGYSEYFASAMTVLLRSVDVPARLATGYTVGDRLTDTDLYVITDSHSHAWVEVYFPKYGWIPFEPTPGAELPGVYEPAAEELPPGLAGMGDGASLEDFCFDEDDDLCEDELEPPQPGGSNGSAIGWRERLRSIAPWLSAAVVLFMALAGACWLLWKRYMIPSGDPRTAYRRLGLLGALGSTGPAVHQTPYQYLERLRTALPGHDEEVSALVGAYVRSRYGAKGLAGEESQLLVKAWLKVRLPLLRRVFIRSST